MAIPTAPDGPKPSGLFRRTVYQLRTEGAGSSRDGVAVGVGVFVGCLPIYGIHLGVCWVLGALLRVNRLKMYLAANVSNPFFAPALILMEIQLGAWLRRGEFHALALATIRTTDPWIFGGDLIVGSIILGGVLGALLGTATWLATRSSDDDPVFVSLVRRASDRYISTSITAWEFARGKMRGDPLYRAALFGGMLPPGGTLVDVGCGQGLMLALLVEAARDAQRGEWTASAPPPVFDTLVGIEMRRRVASIAKRALGESATIVAGDARTSALPQCRAALFFDVLHMVPGAEQEQLLRAAARVLEPGGVILVREADAASGWRFQAVRIGNRLKALAFGNWRQSFHFRTRVGWAATFEAAGFEVAVQPPAPGTPFGNLLFLLTRRGGGPA